MCQIENYYTYEKFHANPGAGNKTWNNILLLDKLNNDCHY